MKRKKREFQSSELVKSFAKIYGFENKLIAFEIKDFLENYLDDTIFKEITKVDLKDKIVLIYVNSPLLKNDLRLKKAFFLKKLQEKFGTETLDDLIIF